MLKDRYDLALTTTSDAARDAYVQASGLALTFYPGALEAYDRAIAADPGFALAHVGKALVLLRQGDVAAARTGRAPAKGLASRADGRGPGGGGPSARRRGRPPPRPGAGVPAGRGGGRATSPTSSRCLRARPRP